MTTQTTQKADLVRSLRNEYWQPGKCINEIVSIRKQIEKQAKGLGIDLSLIMMDSNEVAEKLITLGV